MKDIDFVNIKWDIIVQGGQSNADGNGIGSVINEWVPSPNVFYLEAEKDGCMIDGNVSMRFPDKPLIFKPAEERYINNVYFGDFSLTFAKQYEQELLATGRKILIIRAAVGGTGFIRKHWGLQDVLYQKMVEMTQWALKQNEENRLIAFLWHQGEEDVCQHNNPEDYKFQLRTMVRDFRERFGNNVPFIAADFVNEWKYKNIESCQPITDKIQEIVQEEGRSYFVDTAGLLSNNQKNGGGDEIHFCREALHELGYRYFNAYKRIVFEK